MSNENSNTIPAPPVPFPDEEKWFKGIYDCYWKKLFAYCVHYVNDEALAEEIIQDIFFSLWERRRSIDLHAPIEHYLIRAAKYKVIDHLRAKATRSQYATAFEKEKDWSLGTEEEVGFNELSENITTLVDTLPVQRQTVFRLSREQGLNNREIASQLLISEKTVEYHMTKALGFLRRKLSEYGY